MFVSYLLKRWHSQLKVFKPPLLRDEIPNWKFSKIRTEGFQIWIERCLIWIEGFQIQTKKFFHNRFRSFALQPGQLRKTKGSRSVGSYHSTMQVSSNPTTKKHTPFIHGQIRRPFSLGSCSGLPAMRLGSLDKIPRRPRPKNSVLSMQIHAKQDDRYLACSLPRLW